eukprot:gb/GEZN01004223.1/.p1 GENE.gb/GEZN01004223.1/~~gb/GEZN01004223.1/.p1  ORF type:complete len:253 (+),score=51.46 gb/GEZN01004223.1/:988-1746(+)
MHGRVPLPFDPAPKLSPNVFLSEGWLFRLVRPDVARLVIETLPLHMQNKRSEEDEEEDESGAFVYHIMGNSRLFKQRPLHCLRFPMDCCEAIDMLLTSWPAFLTLQQLPLPRALAPEDNNEGLRRPQNVKKEMNSVVYVRTKKKQKVVKQEEEEVEEEEKGENVPGSELLPLASLGKDFVFRRRLEFGLQPHHFPDKAAGPPLSKKQQKKMIKERQDSESGQKQKQKYTLRESAAALLMAFYARGLLQVLKN